MANLHIVTDSGARFGNPRLFQQYPVTVVPYKLEIGGKTYREDIDISGDEIMRLIRTHGAPPRLIPPTDAEFAEVYANLSRGYDGIISIHTSRELTRSWYNARQAAQQIADSVEIAVVDSRTVCAGQGMLVRVAGEAVLAHQPFEEIVQQVRGAAERIYSAYYVESLDYLRENGILTEARTILGTMLGIKPFLSIEEGKLQVTEKARSRSQAIEKLVEFIVEFEQIEDAIIVQHRTHITEQARLLQDRLSVEFPGRHFPYAMYGVTLAAMLGGDAIGVVVLESELEGFEDD
jgi:DegV family protein with EDD domain